MVVNLLTVLGDVVGATAHRYGCVDSRGNRMDTAAVVANPSAGGYLAIYHTNDVVSVASSDDLLTWEFRAALDDEATQPVLYPLPDGGFLTAVEYNRHDGVGAFLRFRHYPDLAALYAATFDRDRTVARTLSACHEGTPTVRAVSPDLSVLDVDFHYHWNCDVDRQARGRLIDFRTWTAAPFPERDRVLEAATGGRPVRGNIGDRERFTVDGVEYLLYEVQFEKDDFGTWRIYLYDPRSDSASPLPIVTHGGTTAFANPNVAVLTAPSGRPAVVMSLFVPGEGAAPGEAGQLIYYRELAGDS